MIHFRKSSAYQFNNPRFWNCWGNDFSFHPTFQRKGPWGGSLLLSIFMPRVRRRPCLQDGRDFWKCQEPVSLHRWDVGNRPPGHEGRLLTEQEFSGSPSSFWDSLIDTDWRVRKATQNKVNVVASGKQDSRGPFWGDTKTDVMFYTMPLSAPVCLHPSRESNNNMQTRTALALLCRSKAKAWHQEATRSKRFNFGRCLFFYSPCLINSWDFLNSALEQSEVTSSFLMMILFSTRGTSEIMKLLDSISWPVSTLWPFATIATWI